MGLLLVQGRDGSLGVRYPNNSVIVSREALYLGKMSDL